MEAGADVTIPTAGRESGITPLHLAVAAPAVSSTQDATPEELAELMLEKGADVDARFRTILLTKKKGFYFSFSRCRDVFLRTPLWYAAFHGRARLAQVIFIF